MFRPPIFTCGLILFLSSSSGKKTSNPALASDDEWGGIEHIDSEHIDGETKLEEIL